MATLSRDLRKTLERAVLEARGEAEAGARKALDQLAVAHHEPWPTMTAVQQSLRRRLRARGRQLGDHLKDGGRQSIEHLVAECAYEQWHRMLFARFLAECGLLIEPGSGVPVSVDECKELGRERGADWIALAAAFAQGMLPQIFRSDDAVLEIGLPAENRQPLELLLMSLPSQVFLADDSLGWVYQFWQSEEKERINKSELKVDAEALPAVTQLFTEDYMVLFLLHNTIGAWWAGKVLAARPELACHAASEEEVRDACALPGVTWSYLRLMKNQGRWRPIAGAFHTWPHDSRQLRILDPCMGSGHFLVFALPLLVAIRIAEEGLSTAAAVAAVLRDNLNGLEIDPRCAQIGAFNLALTGWKLAGWQPVPRLNVACCGLALSATRNEWVGLAGTDDRARRGMELLFELFAQAPLLGSLIDPDTLHDTLISSGFETLKPLLDEALRQEQTGETHHELAVTALGVTVAAGMLSSKFHLVVTNVPYLVRGKQCQELQDYCSDYFQAGDQDLATVFVHRCRRLTALGGAHATVTPQNWVFTKSYSTFRQQLLAEQTVCCVARIGSGSTVTLSWDVLRSLAIISNAVPEGGQVVSGVEASAPDEAGRSVALASGPISIATRQQLIDTPDCRFALSARSVGIALENVADSLQGIATGDYKRFGRCFWEQPLPAEDWELQQSTVESTIEYGGRHYALFWQKGKGELASSPSARIQGTSVIGRSGVAVTQMRRLPASLFSGTFFDNNVAVIVPRTIEDLGAIWMLCSSDDFSREVRRLDEKIGVTNATLAKVPFDRERWFTEFARMYPSGLPEPYSDSPTEWVHHGSPAGSHEPLQVACCRLVGYTWPVENDDRIVRSQATSNRVSQSRALARHVDADGIVCLSSLRGERPAAERLIALLADCWGSAWSPDCLNELLASVGYAGASLDGWLRDGFFEQHCALFHQRPFVWQIWDGRKDGFSALVNYHRLCGPAGEGRRTFEKLIYTYLGDWIDRQRADQMACVAGAEARLVAAGQLKQALEGILVGETPLDIFVRWKPLTAQPIGWVPDVADGVRVNIRPFVLARLAGSRGKTYVLRVNPKISWGKDKGREAMSPSDEYPWFCGWDGQTADFAGGAGFDGNRWNDLHYSREFKMAARRKKGLA